MTRVSAPNTTEPGRAGALAASALAAASAAAALATPATSATRTPPAAGTVNSCERIVSPSTTASAVTRDPAGTAMNCARPCPSVTPVTRPSGVTRVTSWSGTLLPMRSRTTRTVTAALGSSGAGSGTPDIWAASGIATCAARAVAAVRARAARVVTSDVRGRRLMPASPATRRTACRSGRRRRSPSGRLAQAVPSVTGAAAGSADDGRSRRGAAQRQVALHGRAVAAGVELLHQARRRGDAGGRASPRNRRSPSCASRGRTRAP